MTGAMNSSPVPCGSPRTPRCARKGAPSAAPWPPASPAMTRGSMRNCCFIRAVDDIDEMHIRLLGRMAAPFPPAAPGWSAALILDADPGLAGSVAALLGTLELHGLIGAVVPAHHPRAERRPDLLQHHPE